MRKQFSIFVAAMLLVCFTACNNEVDSIESSGNGSLKISFAFEKQGRAATSDALPTTGWENIKKLQLVMVQGEFVTVVRDVKISEASSPTGQLFERIPTGDYKVYLIGNNQLNGNPHDQGSAVIGTDKVIQAGTKFADIIFKLAESTAVLGGGSANQNDNKYYGEASELFIGHELGKIEADKEAKLNIVVKRAVSLLRVRIDQTDVTSEANTIFFTGVGEANTSIRLRRHAHSLSLTTDTPFASPIFGATREKEAFVSTKAFKTENPTGAGSGYTGNMGIGADFTLWNDYVILPGGSTSVGAEKFSLLLSGHAPKNYVGINGVVSTGEGEGARVWWQADVTGAIGANGVLSLNVVVATKGYVSPTPPDFATYGSLTITASIANWNAVTNVEVPM